MTQTRPGAPLRGVINNALVYVPLAGFVSLVYVVIVFALSRAVGTHGGPNIALSVVAAAIVAVAFEPARERLQRVANRLVFGVRATPYEVLADFCAKVTEAVSVDDVLPHMAEAAALGLGAARSRVRVLLPGGRRRSISWPDDSFLGPYDHTVEVNHDGQPVGDISVSKASDARLAPAEERLLSDLASQAGLAFYNARVSTELEARLEEMSNQAREIAASRKRLITAQDAERRRLEQRIHDRVQERLEHMSAGVGAAQQALRRDPRRAVELIDELGRRATSTLDELRDVARGIFPPLLADKGLMPALRAHIAKSRLPVEVECDESVEAARFEQPVETTIYSCCLEAMHESASGLPGEPITLSLEANAGSLGFRVAHAGRGVTTTKSDLQDMADRLEALGGRLDVRMAPDGGAAIEGRLPT